MPEPYLTKTEIKLTKGRSGEKRSHQLQPPAWPAETEAPAGPGKPGSSTAPMGWGRDPLICLPTSGPWEMVPVNKVLQPVLRDMVVRNGQGPRCLRTCGLAILMLPIRWG